MIIQMFIFKFLPFSNILFGLNLTYRIKYLRALRIYEAPKIKQVHVFSLLISGTLTSHFIIVFVLFYLTLLNLNIDKMWPNRHEPSGSPALV